MAQYLFGGPLDNKVHDISYEQLRSLYLDNRKEEREGREITKSSYRGENQIFPESLPSLHRKLKQYSSKKEKELYRLVADMRIAEFSCLLKKFSHVREWKNCDILYEALAQHYGLETGWLDITNDFNVALFFATCYWDRKLKKWQPLTKEQTEVDENHRYGMLFHMPSNRMPMRWSRSISQFMPWTDKIVGHTEEGNAIHEHLDYPRYTGDMENLIYPLGFQPFMRCHMQNGYGIYMRKPNPLQQDFEFEKLRFRHSEKLSQDVFELMHGGELIYPHEGLKQADFIIDEISRLCVFSEEAFQYALYRSHYYRLSDEEQCRRDLAGFLIDDRPVVIQKEHPWKISAGRRKKIDTLYQEFSLESWYGIRVLERKKIPAPSAMFEPWMMMEEETEPGVMDFKVRSSVNCGSSIVERDLFYILDTIMTAKTPDF